MERLLLGGLLVAMLGGCAGTGAPREPGLEASNERMRLAVGERGAFYGGAIIVTPTEIGDEHALVTVETSGSVSEGRLTTDPRGFVEVASFRVHLVSADTGGPAVIQVGRAPSRQEMRVASAR